MKMLRLKLESYQIKQTERGYPEEVCKQEMMAMNVEDNPSNRRVLLDNIARMLAVENVQ
jgi:hypothetical protein